MRQVTVTYRDQGREFVAEFQRSEDCGYRPGALLLDLPNGSHISIRKHRTAHWVETLVHNGIGQQSVTHPTRKAALYSAASSLAAEVLECEDITE